MSERTTRGNLIIMTDLAIIVALVIVSWAFAGSSLLQEQPRLVGYAILLDLTVTVAVCHWLCGVRLGGMPAWTLIPLLALGLHVDAGDGARRPVALRLPITGP